METKKYDEIDWRATKIDGFGVVNHMGNPIGRQTVFVIHCDNKISDSDCSACSALLIYIFHCLFPFETVSLVIYVHVYAKKDIFSINFAFSVSRRRDGNILFPGHQFRNVIFDDPV